MNETTPQKRPSVGVGVVVLRTFQGQQEVLLIRRGRAPWLGHWSIPGGHQELLETVRETAAREVLEETGVTIANLRLIDVVDSISHHPDGALQRHITLIDFRADWTGGDPKAGDDAAEAIWVPLTDLGQYQLWSETIRIITTGAAMSGA